MVIAYLRISTGKQHIANQQDEIMRFALSKDLEIHKWVTEVVSGKKAKKERKLGKTLRRLKQGDILIVTELSRLSRTLTEIMSIVGECLERKITIYSTKDGYAFDDSINSKVLCFRPGSGDRAQPHLHANQRGSRTPPCRRHPTRTPQRKLYETANPDRQP